MEYIFAASFFAVFIESMVSYFTQPIKDRRDYLRFVTAVVGIGMALAFDIDLILSLAGLSSPYVGWLGTVMTGIAMGRGSNYIADVVSFLKGAKASSVSVDTARDVTVNNPPAPVV